MSNMLDDMDWKLFLCLDYSIRLYVVVFSAFGMLLLFLTIDFCPWVSNSLKQTNSSARVDTVLFILVSVGLELANAVLIDWVFFKPSRLSLSLAAKNCFSDIRFSCIICAIVACCFLNPISVFITNATY